MRVPFPYTDRETRQRRPALVVSSGEVGRDAALLWVLMITSAENRGWPGDVALGPPEPGTGLPAPSIVRTTKIATVEARHCERIGRVATDILDEVQAAVGHILGLR